MAPLLRRRLVCFYCGCKSAQKQDRGLRLFKCETCEAVNHLDENGEITDPPAPEIDSERRHGQFIPRATSPEFATPDNSLFCETCILNQTLLTQNLAAYLPATTDPRYAQYEATLPQYRKSLEERYPQVCGDCEPRARELIRLRGRAAAGANLRQRLDKTRKRILIRPRWRWGHLVVYFGALIWWLGLLGQTVWNAFGAMASTSDGPEIREGAMSWKQCLTQGLRTGHVDGSCADSTYSFATRTLLLGIMFIWWNPCQSDRLNGVPGRIVGLREFYRLQVIVNLMRVLAWYVLRSNNLEQSVVKASHATMVVVNLVVSLAAYRTPYIDRSLRLFQPSDESLLSQKQARSTPPHSQPSSQTQYLAQPFPISSLAEAPQRPSVPSYPTPTPVSDDEGYDAMDLDTPQKTFQYKIPTHQIHQPSQLPPEPSPFHGKLPPAPMNKAYNQLNTLLQKANPKEIQPITVSSNGIPFKGPTNEQNWASTTKRNFQFADAKFRPAKSMDATGLASLFEGVFSLSDEPPEIRMQTESKQGRDRNQNNNPKKSKGPFEYNAPTSTIRPPSAFKRAFWQRMISTILLCIAYWAWSFGPTYNYAQQPLRYSALAIATLVAAAGLVEALHPQKAIWRLSDVMAQTIELVSTLYFTHILRNMNRSYGPIDLIAERGPLWLLGAMFSQEVAGLVWLVLERRQAARARAHTHDISTPGQSQIIARMPAQLSVESTSPARPLQQPQWSAQQQQQQHTQLLPEPQSQSQLQPYQSQSQLQSQQTFQSHSALSTPVATPTFSGLSLGGPSSPSFSSSMSQTSGVAPNGHASWKGGRPVAQRNLRSRREVEMPPWARGGL